MDVTISLMGRNFRFWGFFYFLIFTSDIFLVFFSLLIVVLFLFSYLIIDIVCEGWVVG